MHTYKESCLKYCLDKMKYDLLNRDFYGFILALPLLILVNIIALPVSIVIDFCIALYKAT